MRRRCNCFARPVLPLSYTHRPVRRRLHGSLSKCARLVFPINSFGCKKFQTPSRPHKLRTSLPRFSPRGPSPLNSLPYNLCARHQVAPGRPALHLCPRAAYPAPTLHRSSQPAYPALTAPCSPLCTHAPVQPTLYLGSQLAYPAPTLHLPRTYPALTLHLPCTHPIPTPVRLTLHSYFYAIFSIS